MTTLTPLVDIPDSATVHCIDGTQLKLDDLFVDIEQLGEFIKEQTSVNASP